MSRERVDIARRRTLAEAEQRPVIRMNADLELRRIQKIDRWIKAISSDPRRTW